MSHYIALSKKGGKEVSSPILYKETYYDNVISCRRETSLSY